MLTLFLSSVETKQYSQQFPSKYIIFNYCLVLVSVPGLLNAFFFSQSLPFAKSNVGVLLCGPNLMCVVCLCTSINNINKICFLKQYQIGRFVSLLTIVSFLN